MQQQNKDTYLKSSFYLKDFMRYSYSYLCFNTSTKIRMQTKRQTEVKQHFKSILESAEKLETEFVLLQISLDNNQTIHIQFSLYESNFKHFLSILESAEKLKTKKKLLWQVRLGNNQTIQFNLYESNLTRKSKNCDLFTLER